MYRYKNFSRNHYENTLLTKNSDRLCATNAVLKQSNGTCKNGDTKMDGRKIRVVHIAECAGGVERYLCSLLKYANRDKFENILIVSNLYKKENYINLVDNIETLDIPHSVGFKTFLVATDLRKLLKKYNPDIIYAHSSIAGAVARLAALGMNSKCIYNPHGWAFNMHKRNQKIFAALEKIMAPFCDAIVCISDAEKESAISNKICKADKLHVIYNGIDLQEYENEVASLEKLNIPENAFVVGMVGRICRQKAPDIFVKMAGIISRQIDNAYFVIVGDVLEGLSKEKEEIQFLAKQLNTKLIITGWVDNPLDYIKRFSVACLLSRWEGFGLAVPEYMVCGKPIVACNVDAIPNLITNMQTGLLVDVDDYESAAKAVIELQSNYELRSNIIANAKKEVYERFDARRMTQDVENLIKSLVNKLD